MKMKKISFRTLCVLLTMVVLFAQLFAVPLTTSAEDAEVTVPEICSENIAVKLPSVLDYTGTKVAETITSFGETFDLNAYDYIEFDLYVVATGDLKQPYFFVYDSGYSGSGTPAPENRKQYKMSGVKNQQWNHVRISPYTLATGSGTGDLGKAAGFYLSNLSSKTRYYLANICLTDVVIPEKKNVLDESKEVFGTIKHRGGDYESAQAFFNEDQSVYDISENGFVEFDLCVFSENAEETITFGLADSTYDGTNGVNTAVKSAKFGEWQHFLISLSEFEGSADLTKVVSFAVVSPVEQAKYFVNNIAVTDQEVRFISHCEAALDELGSWNSDATYFVDVYKTEGTKSIALNVIDQAESLNNFRFGFDLSVDFTQTEFLCFDLMIDKIDLAQKNTASVTLSSSKRAKSENHTYELAFDEMHDGWNNIKLPISEFQGDADMTSIKCFTIVIHSGLDPRDYLVLCLDNVRAEKTFVVEGEVVEEEVTEPENDPEESETGDAGNTEQVPETDNSPGVVDDPVPETDDFHFDDFSFEDVSFDETAVDDDVSEEKNQQDEGVAPKKVIRRYKKNPGSTNNSNIDRIVLICVSAGCGLLLLLGLIFLLLTKRKLDKTTNPTQ